MLLLAAKKETGAMANEGNSTKDCQPNKWTELNNRGLKRINDNKEKEKTWRLTDPEKEEST